MVCYCLGTDKILTRGVNNRNYIVGVETGRSRAFDCWQSKALCDDIVFRVLPVTIASSCCGISGPAFRQFPWII